jgi:hypothetical protein
VTDLQFKIEDMNNEHQKVIATFGTLDCGYETMAEAWPALEHVFASGGYHSKAEYILPQGRLKGSLLDQHPVDLVVVERGQFHKPPTILEANIKPKWEILISNAKVKNRPKVIIEMWPDKAATWEEGPMSKSNLVRWQHLGYASRYQRVDATQVGGAVTQKRLVIVRMITELQNLWRWRGKDTHPQMRPMSNLLVPPGLIPRRAYIRPPVDTHVWEAGRDPMPAISGSWISTEQGTRRLLPEELAKALGINKEKLSDSTETNARTLRNTTSIFHWEYLSDSLSFQDSSTKIHKVEDDDLIYQSIEEILERLGEEDDHLITDPIYHPILWRPPDLKKNGDWYKARMKKLEEVVKEYGDDKQKWIKEGEEILENHRNNYDQDGPKPKKLQLIWWEFPKEHRDAIRDGSRMNFMSPPETKIHMNSEMTEEQREVAGEFVDELLDLGVVDLPPEDEPVLANGPLFCITKPGQPGQWRVLSNMKEGGQNAFIAPDPVYLNRPLHILEQLYSGGFSSVVDASKFFYQFKTHKEDRPWLGLLHPITEALLTYCGLPMGGGNSPALAGKYGLSILRTLRMNHDEFSKDQGKPNCWWTKISYAGYDPKLGHGFVFHQSNGDPSVLIWVHVDDFFIHGHNLNSAQRGLRLFLDLALRVGMLCHPGKLYPPAQLQLYTGFIFDTRRIPTLRIPISKRERALAMVEHLLE